LTLPASEAKIPPVTHLALLPVTEPGEVKAFLRSLPIAVDVDGFTRFALGFPHRYLNSTPVVEIVRHYALMGSLATRAVVSSLAREGALWKLCLIARDRKFLFSRIAGALSRFGMDIARAEAFANANALVLDTFVFADRRAHFDDDAQRRRFQVFLEDVVEGKAELDAEPNRPPREPAAAGEPLSVSWDPDAHPTATRMIVEGEDSFGLLHLLTRRIAESGYDIELAYVDTRAGRVCDEFYITRDGTRLDAAMRDELARALADVTSSAPPLERPSRSPAR
jgi:[protein-PII] uridylyltransferase